MPRKVYLIVYNFGHPSVDHWALFVPNVGSSDTGKLVDVHGGPDTGFHTQFKRNYSLAFSDKQYRLLLLSDQLPDSLVRDSGGRYCVEYDPVDEFDRVAYGVRAPGARPRRTSSFSSGNVKNCQTWIKEVVSALVERNHLPRSALSVVDRVPR